MVTSSSNRHDQNSEAKQIAEAEVLETFGRSNAELMKILDQVRKRQKAERQEQTLLPQQRDPKAEYLSQLRFFFPFVLRNTSLFLFPFPFSLCRISFFLSCHLLFGFHVFLLCSWSHFSPFASPGFFFPLSYPLVCVGDDAADLWKTLESHTFRPDTHFLGAWRQGLRTPSSHPGSTNANFSSSASVSGSKETPEFPVHLETMLGSINCDRQDDGLLTALRWQDRAAEVFRSRSPPPDVHSMLPGAADQSPPAATNGSPSQLRVDEEKFRSWAAKWNFDWRTPTNHRRKQAEKKSLLSERARTASGERPVSSIPSPLLSSCVLPLHSLDSFSASIKCPVFCLVRSCLSSRLGSSGLSDEVCFLSFHIRRKSSSNSSSTACPILRISAAEEKEEERENQR